MPDGRTFPTGVAGHYMIIGKEAEHRQAPFKITFSNETDDAIILAFSSVGATTSLKGVSVPTLTSWTPPKSTKEPVDEAVMLSTWKLPLNSVQSVEELTDTETCKLRALTDKLISHLERFTFAGIKDAKGLRTLATKNAQNNFEKTVSRTTMHEPFLCLPFVHVPFLHVPFLCAPSYTYPTHTFLRAPSYTYPTHTFLSDVANRSQARRRRS